MTVAGRLEIPAALAVTEGFLEGTIAAPAFTAFKSAAIIAALVSAAFGAERLFVRTISAPAAFAAFKSAAVVAAFVSTAAAFSAERLFIGAIAATGTVVTAFKAAAFGTVAIRLFEAPAAAPALESAFAALKTGLVLTAFSATFGAGATGWAATGSTALEAASIPFKFLAKAAAARATLAFSTTAEFAGFGLELTFFL